MKRVLQKTFAMALTIAMVLSLGVSALATETTGSGVQSALSGTVTNEGAMPAEVLKFVVAAPSANDFDLIVDPHDLIRLSQAAEKAKTIYNSGTFEEGAYAFFKKVEDGETSYGKESKTLTVINKSSTPITVNLEATLKRTATATEGINKITLVDTEAELSSLTKKPGLYLAVKEGSTETPVSQNAFGDLTVTVPSTLQSFITGTKFEWIDGVSNSLKKQLNDSITSAANTYQLPVTVSSTGTIKVQDAGNWDNPATKVSSDAATKLIDSVTSNVRVLTISVPESGKAVNVAKITFYFDMAAVMANTTAVTGNVELGKWNGKPYAKVDTLADKKEGAYSIQANSTQSGYLNVLDTSIENEDFPKKVFNLKAAINRDDAWDEVEGASLNDAIEVTWKIDQYIAPVAPVLTVETAGAKTNDIAVVKFTGGKGEYHVKDLLNVSYTADKLTLVEKTNKLDATTNKTDTLRVTTAPVAANNYGGEFELKVVSKMIGEGVPATCKATFLMVNDAGKVQTEEVAFDFSVEG